MRNARSRTGEPAGAFVAAGHVHTDRETRYGDDRQSGAAPSPPRQLLLSGSAPRA
jgi:hypothetical protein